MTPRLIRSAAAVLVLVTASIMLAGCGLSLVPRNLPLLSGRSQKAPAGLPGKIADAREQVALDPTQPYWPYQLGQLYLAADSVAQAETALRAALARDRFYAPALSLLSKLEFERGRHQQAVEMLEAARAEPARFPGGFPPALLAGLALHYDALGRLDLARSVMDQLPRDLAATAPAVVYVGLRGETPESATDLAAAARADNPKSAANQNNFGITRLRSGDPAAARKAFLQAIELDPKLPGPYYNLAIIDKYYVFDDEAAARWFKEYWVRSKVDPDSLLAVFGGHGVRTLAEGNEP